MQPGCDLSDACMVVQWLPCHLTWKMWRARQCGWREECRGFLLNFFWVVLKSAEDYPFVIALLPYFKGGVLLSIQLQIPKACYCVVWVINYTNDYAVLFIILLIFLYRFSELTLFKQRIFLKNIL